MVGHTEGFDVFFKPKVRWGTYVNVGIHHLKVFFYILLRLYS